MSELFEPVDEVPGVLSPHMAYAKRVIPAFVDSGIKHAHLTNIPPFDVTESTLIATLRQFAIPRGVQVMRRGNELYLVNEKLAGCR